MKKFFNSRGFSLVEVIVAVSIAAISILSVWKVYNFFIKISISNPSLFQASFLAEEGIEAVKFMRDSGWSSNITSLSSDVPYTLVFNGSKWATTTSVVYIDNKFDRRVSVSDVYRDAFGNIGETGSFDPDTKKVLVTVSWKKDISTTTKEITTYVSNIFKN
jgi:prepilin-type N-terminal cleavage/methylation domain-containing protein